MLNIDIKTTTIDASRIRDALQKLRNVIFAFSEKLPNKIKAMFAIGIKSKINTAIHLDIETSFFRYVAFS